MFLAPSKMLSSTETVILRGTTSKVGCVSLGRPSISKERFTRYIPTVTVVVLEVSCARRLTSEDVQFRHQYTDHEISKPQRSDSWSIEYQLAKRGYLAEYLSVFG